MAEEKFVLTRIGYERLQRELDYLENMEAEEVAEQLADVHDDTEYGEEATFFDAVVTKELLDGRIAHLKMVLARAEIIDEDLNPHQVDPGDRVTVWDFVEQEEVVFDLLGSAEVTHARRRGVSIDSPVGKALLGKRVGEVVEIEVPEGKARYMIRKIDSIPEDEQ